MIEFIKTSSEIRMFFTVLFGLCVVSQTFSASLNFYLYQKRKIIEITFDVLVLLEIFALSLTYGEMLFSHESGIVMIESYAIFRTIIFILITILGMYTLLIEKNTSKIGIILFSTISLPVTEKLLGKLFPHALLVFLIYFLIKNLKKYISQRNFLKNSISALSIKNAIDTMNAGVLFCETDGYIVLSNNQMQNLMLEITGRIWRNAHKFLAALDFNENKEKYKKISLEGQSVYLLPKGSAWMFTKTDIISNSKKYIHVSATEVSEQWLLTEQLQKQVLELSKKSNTLKKSIENLERISEEKELEKVRIRTHDILGQRLSIILSMLQNEEKLDYKTLVSISKSLFDDLNAETQKKSPKDSLNNIINVFSSIGIEINVEGDLPSDEGISYLFVDIIREASTNGVRHGFANRINVKLSDDNNINKIVIKNNGNNAAEPICLGSGLTTINKKVEEKYGKMQVVTQPEFKITIYIDKSGGDFLV